MIKIDEKAVFYAFEMVLRPLVRFCLKHSIKIQDVITALKFEFVRQAKAELEAQQQQESISRISVMTGMQRTEVARYCEPKIEDQKQASVIGKVIAQWRYDPRFQTPSGEPRTLSAKGKKSEFAQLVQSVSKYINPYTVAFELERLGYIEQEQDSVNLKGQVHLLTDDYEESFSLLSSDVDDLVSGVSHNVLSQPAIPNLHLRTEYDNVSLQHIDEIRDWLLDQGSIFHEQAREFFSKYDKDVNPDLEDSPGGARVVLSAFSNVELQTVVNEDKQQLDEDGL